MGVDLVTISRDRGCPFATSTSSLPRSPPIPLDLSISSAAPRDKPPSSYSKTSPLATTSERSYKPDSFSSVIRILPAPLLCLNICRKSLIDADASASSNANMKPFSVSSSRSRKLISPRSNPPEARYASRRRCPFAEKNRPNDSAMFLDVSQAFTECQKTRWSGIWDSSLTARVVLPIPGMPRITTSFRDGSWSAEPTSSSSRVLPKKRRTIGIGEDLMAPFLRREVASAGTLDESTAGSMSFSETYWCIATAFDFPSKVSR